MYRLGLHTLHPSPETMTKRPKRPRDPIALAKMIGDIATGQATDKASAKKSAGAVLPKRPPKKK